MATRLPAADAQITIRAIDLAEKWTDFFPENEENLDNRLARFDKTYKAISKTLLCDISDSGSMGVTSHKY